MLPSGCDCRKTLWRERSCLIATSAMTDVGDVMSEMSPCGAFPDLMEPQKGLQERLLFPYMGNAT